MFTGFTLLELCLASRRDEAGTLARIRTERSDDSVHPFQTTGSLPLTQRYLHVSDSTHAGKAIRTNVMGAEFVNRAMENATDFTLPLQDFINEHAWGSVWLRGELTLKTRSLITLAILTALKAPHELKGHVRGALNNGCTAEEIREVLLHCAVYAGVPAAGEAFRAAQSILEDL